MISKVLKKISGLLICLIGSLFVSANDTLKLVTPTPISSFGQINPDNTVSILGKYFTTPYSSGNGVFRYLIAEPGKHPRYTFENCGFDLYGTEAPRIDEKETKGNFDILRSHVRYFPITKTRGEVRIFESSVDVISVESTDGLSLTLGGDSLMSFLVFNKNKNLKIQFTGCLFKDSGEVRILNSDIIEFNFGWDKRSGSLFNFSNDTIRSFTAVMADFDSTQQYAAWYKKKNIFEFYKCHIDADFIFFQEIPNATIIFNSCSFGPNAYLGGMMVERLSFKNCKNFATQIYLQFVDNRLRTEVSFTNTDVDKIRFDFMSNMVLVFDSSHSRDVRLNSYKSLLEKYDREGRESSYKYLNIQYQKYKYSSFWNFIVKGWWYYSYRPGLVFKWTLIFLGIFYLFNLIWWKQMHAAYPIFGDQLDADRIKKRKSKLLSTVLLFTLFIFFSLRINFERLKLLRHRYVYMFIFQYLVGLWCLVFIFRFILKV